MEQLPLFRIERPREPGSTGSKVSHPLPPEIIIAAIELMGAIDLDPYCVDEEMTLVPAKVHFGVAANALKKDWGPKKRRVFLTPPPGRSTAAWMNKLCDEYEAGNVGQAVAYLRAALDSDWWQRLMTYPICIVQRQLRALEGKRSTTVPWAVVYLGTNLKGFAAAFKDVGTLYVPYRQQLAEQHPHKDKDQSSAETIQYGDYTLAINMNACFVKLGHPSWDARQQGQLRKLILAIPGVLPAQYSSTSKTPDGKTSLIFSFRKEQTRQVAKAVRRLIANESL